jgi:hypothetical protein
MVVENTAAYLHCFSPLVFGCGPPLGPRALPAQAGPPPAAGAAQLHAAGGSCRRSCPMTSLRTAGTWAQLQACSHLALDSVACKVCKQ